jgi:hypothetical protein
MAIPSFLHGCQKSMLPSQMSMPLLPQPRQSLLMLQRLM